MLTATLAWIFTNSWGPSRLLALVLELAICVFKESIVIIERLIKYLEKLLPPKPKKPTNLSSKNPEIGVVNLDSINQQSLLASFSNTWSIHNLSFYLDDPSPVIPLLTSLPFSHKLHPAPLFALELFLTKTHILGHKDSVPIVEVNSETENESDGELDQCHSDPPSNWSTIESSGERQSTYELNLHLKCQLPTRKMACDNSILVNVTASIKDEVGQTFAKRSLKRRLSTDNSSIWFNKLFTLQVTSHQTEPLFIKDKLHLVCDIAYPHTQYCM